MWVANLMNRGGDDMGSASSTGFQNGINKKKAWMKETVVSEITGISVSTLRKNRFNRRGIPYTKIGRSVFYDYDDIVNFMESHKILS